MTWVLILFFVLITLLYNFFFVAEHSQWFTLQQNENLVVLISNQVNPLPQDILDQHSNLIFAIVANKPNTIGGRAAIHIDLPKGKIVTSLWLR